MKINIAILLATAFANANAASRIFISTNPVPDADLSQIDYEALAWTEIRGIGSRGEMGKITNVLTYDTWDTKVIQKAKGMTDAGSPELEVARIPGDAGQAILELGANVGNNNNYAFKELRADGTTADNGTVIYNRGLVVGQRRPGGRNEDFDLLIFTLAFQQEEIAVDPLATGNAPTLTVNPAITGTAEVGETLTLSNGTFTGDAVITYSYQWFAGGVAIAGAIANTFELTAAQVGKVITARVAATNASGSASGYAPATTAVAP